MTRATRLFASGVVGLCLYLGAVAGAAEPAEGAGGLAFLRANLPSRQVYLGELVPVRIQAFFQPGIQASINGVPVLKSDAFTTSQITDKPRQTQEIVNGKPYAVLTWNTAVSAVKTGDFPLSLQLPCTVQYQERPARVPDLRELFGRDPFGDGDDPFAGFGGPMLGRSMLQDFFGKTREKQVLLTSRAEVVHARPLPEENRPPGFSGAIGDFALSANASPTRVTAGDPITLKLEISGEGNFDRVSAPMLPGSAAWKTYPPSARFTATNAAGSQGTKTLEQVVVALQAGPQELPPLHFSFFDPRSRRYVSRATAPIVVQVALAPAQRVADGAPEAQQQAPTARGDDLLPNQVETVRGVRSLRPLLFQPWFLTAQAAPLLVLAAGLLLQRRRRRLQMDPSLEQSRVAGRAIRRQLAAMDRAAAAQDTRAFFRAARAALQQRLGQRFRTAPEAITLSEIDSRLNGDAAGLRPIFEFADHITYSGQDLGATDLSRWRQIVLEQLRNLEASS